MGAGLNGTTLAGDTGSGDAVLTDGSEQRALASQVLASYGHDPEDLDVSLLLSDPTVVCFRDGPHRAAVFMAIMAILIVVAGYPAVLLLWILPEIDRTVRVSPSATRLDAAELQLRIALAADGRTTKQLPWWEQFGHAFGCGAWSCTGSGRGLPASGSKTDGSASPKAVDSQNTSGPFSHDAARGTIRQMRQAYAADQSSAQQLAAPTSGPSINKMAGGGGGGRLSRRGSTSGVQFSAPMCASKGAGDSASGGISANGDADGAMRYTSAPVLLQPTASAADLLGPGPSTSTASESESVPTVTRSGMMGAFGVSVSPALARSILETVRDRSLILRQTHRLAYFVDGDYRASRAWVRCVDWAVLLMLAGLERLWVPNAPGRALAAGITQVLVLLVALAVIESASPFLEEYEWKRVGKVGTLLLSALAVGLNTVAALQQHPSMRDRESALHSAALGLTYVVGIGSIGCLLILFGLFWWTLLQEDPESPDAIRNQKERERDRRRASILPKASQKASKPVNGGSGGGSSSTVKRVLDLGTGGPQQVMCMANPMAGTMRAGGGSDLGEGEAGHSTDAQGVGARRGAESKDLQLKGSGRNQV